MRRKNQEITDKKAIEEILIKSKICRLGLIDGNVPYIVPLNYGYRDNALYFHSAPHGKKIQLIKANNRVCFEVEHGVRIIRNNTPCRWETRYRSLIGYGTMEIITNSEQKKEALDTIMYRHGKKGKNIYMEPNVGKVMILKLKIDEVHGKQSKRWN
jgi:nitroimidazol reductase NimA-like FMN-containing flavoprotein (pyridoxamine 5'-phosphate oxidase superfamily)